jgi:hypothetical protein
MAATQRFLALLNGVLSMVVPATVGGSGSAGQIPALDSTTGLLPLSMMPTGIGPSTVPLPTSAALTATSPFVNVYSNAGTATARPADSTAVGSEANGFVLANVGNGGTATVYAGGLITGLTGITPGANYFLGTAGSFTTTPPSNAGNIVQFIGKGYNTTTIEFNPQQPVTVA